MAGCSSRIKKGEVVIEAIDIVKNYGHLQALKGASLKIYAGEITALLGDKKFCVGGEELRNSL